MGAITGHFSLFKESQRGWLIIGQCDASIFCPSLLAFNQSWFRDRYDWGLNSLVSLALHTNALIAENINWMLYGVTLGSTVLYSLVAIYITYVMFDDERIIFRS